MWRTVPQLFEHLRKAAGRRGSTAARRSRARAADPGHPAGQGPGAQALFFEDPFSPEDVGYFAQLRKQTSTPIAMGELFNNPNEYVADRGPADRLHPHPHFADRRPDHARKVATLCEFFAVRTAWHGPGDVSPVGHAANVHLDIATPNFGIQEAHPFSPPGRAERLPGCPELKDGYYWASDRPGLGVDLDEKAGGKVSHRGRPTLRPRLGRLRRNDGTDREAVDTTHGAANAGGAARTGVAAKARL